MGSGTVPRISCGDINRLVPRRGTIAHMHNRAEIGTRMHHAHVPLEAQQHCRVVTAGPAVQNSTNSTCSTGLCKGKPPQVQRVGVLLVWPRFNRSRPGRPAVTHGKLSAFFNSFPLAHSPVLVPTGPPPAPQWVHGGSSGRCTEVRRSRSWICCRCSSAMDSAVAATGCADDTPLRFWIRTTMYGCLPNVSGLCCCLW